MPARGRVLLVEDDYAARTEMAQVLRDAGYEVLEASGGQQAVVLAASADPSMILLDLILPDGAGFELLEDLRRVHDDRRIPIVAVSGFEERVEDARLAGAAFDGYLVKPFGSSELLASVARSLTAHPPSRA